MNQSLNNFLNSLKGKPLEQANKEAESVCGIVDFFDTEDYSVSEKLSKKRGLNMEIGKPTLN